MRMTVTTKRVYGVMRMYPACNLSEAIAAIKMAPTLTNKDISMLVAAGVDVQVMNEDIVK